MKCIIWQCYSYYNPDLNSQLYKIAGGNQRDLARQKNQKKNQELGKGKRNDNLTVEQRKARYLSHLYLMRCSLNTK